VKYRYYSGKRKAPFGVMICLDRVQLSPNAATTVYLSLHNLYPSVLRAAERLVVAAHWLARPKSLRGQSIYIYASVTR